VLTSPVTFLYLACFVSVVVSYAMVAIAAPAQPTKRHLLGCGALVGLWCLADFLSNMASSGAEVRLLALVAAPVWVGLPYLMLRTALIFSERPRLVGSWLFNGLLLLPVGLILWLIFTDRVFSDFQPATANGLYFQSRSSAWQLLSNLYLVGYVIAAVTVVLSATRSMGHGMANPTARLVLCGLAPLAFIGVVVNGALPLLGVHPPFLSSVLLSAFGVMTAVGVLRQAYFEPLKSVRLERDQARDFLNKRDQILAAIPSGVAIARFETFEILYANAPFRELAGVREEGERLPEVLVGSLDDVMEEGRSCELSLGGEGERHVLLHASRVDYAGANVLLITLRDLTEQKKIERDLRVQREQLLQAQKMEAIGNLSAGVAHDFNNQLQAILAYTQFIGETLPRDHDIQADLHEIAKAADRGHSMTKQLLAFSRKQETTPVLLDVNEVLRGLENMLQRILGASIEISVVACAEPAWVEIDKVQLEQVFVTLATNARDAMSKSGALSFDVRRTSTSSSCSVEVRVTDTGCGMEPEVVAKVFEPFFSTKGDHGTGLGLATTFGIIEQARGVIEVSSVVGEGTTFTVILPLADHAAHQGNSAPQLGAAQGTA